MLSVNNLPYLTALSLTLTATALARGCQGWIRSYFYTSLELDDLGQAENQEDCYEGLASSRDAWLNASPC